MCKLTKCSVRFMAQGYKLLHGNSEYVEQNSDADCE